MNYQNEDVSVVERVTSPCATTCGKQSVIVPLRCGEGEEGEVGFNFAQAAAHDHRADGRVGADRSERLIGERDRALHIARVFDDVFSEIQKSD